MNDMQEGIDALRIDLVSVSYEVKYHQWLQQLDQAHVDCSQFIDYVKDAWLTPRSHRCF